MDKPRLALVINKTATRSSFSRNNTEEESLSRQRFTNGLTRLYNFVTERNSQRGKGCGHVISHGEARSHEAVAE